MLNKFLACFLAAATIFQTVSVFAATRVDIPETERALVLRVDSPYALQYNKVVKVDDDNLAITPLIIDDKTLVPLRFISEAFGAYVKWSEEDQSVFVELNGRTFFCVVGNDLVYSNGLKGYIEVAPKQLNDRVYVPLRILTDALGKKLYWDDRGIIVISDKTTVTDKTEKTVFEKIEAALPLN